jgi:hypothetical protein
MSKQPYIILSQEEYKALQHALKEYPSVIIYTHAKFVKPDKRDPAWYRPQWVVYLDYIQPHRRHYPEETSASVQVGKLIGRIAQRYPKRYPHYKIF